MKYNQTVRQALDEKREKLKDKVAHLVICKWELFYVLKPEHEDANPPPGDSIYPMNYKAIQEEAEFFGVEWSEQ